jgi:hypothetical protein
MKTPSVVEYQRSRTLSKTESRAGSARVPACYDSQKRDRALVIASRRGQLRSLPQQVLLSLPDPLIFLAFFYS